MAEILQFEFMRNALAAGLLAGILCGVMGTLVVVNRIVFLSGGIAHAAYGGIGLAFFFGLPLFAGTMGFSIFAALLMATITIRYRHRSDTIIGVIWAVGMATGVILIDLTPGYHVDLMSYLFGSIIAVSDSDLIMMAVSTIFIILFVSLNYQSLLALSYDEEFARIRGIHVTALYLFMVCILALLIVLVMRIVGLVLVIALLTIPSFIMERHTKSIAHMMAGSSILGSLFATAGLIISYWFDLTSGACIILVAAAAFSLSLVFERIVKLSFFKRRS